MKVDDESLCARHGVIGQSPCSGEVRAVDEFDGSLYYLCRKHAGGDDEYGWMFPPLEHADEIAAEGGTHEA